MSKEIEAIFEAYTEDERIILDARVQCYAVVSDKGVCAASGLRSRHAADGLARSLNITDPKQKWEVVDR